MHRRHLIAPDPIFRVRFGPQNGHLDKKPQKVYPHSGVPQKPKNQGRPLQFFAKKRQKTVHRRHVKILVACFGNFEKPQKSPQIFAPKTPKSDTVSGVFGQKGVKISRVLGF